MILVSFRFLDIDAIFGKPSIIIVWKYVVRPCDLFINTHLLFIELVIYIIILFLFAKHTFHVNNHTYTGSATSYKTNTTWTLFYSGRFHNFSPARFSALNHENLATHAYTTKMSEDIAVIIKTNSQPPVSAITRVEATGSKKYHSHSARRHRTRHSRGSVSRPILCFWLLARAKY